MALRRCELKESNAASDVLLPTQIPHCQLPGQPERNLNFAMLELAIHDVFLPVRMSKDRPWIDLNEANRASAQSWFANGEMGDRETYISLRDVCHITGISMQSVNEALINCEVKIREKPFCRAAAVRATVEYLRRHRG